MLIAKHEFVGQSPPRWVLMLDDDSLLNPTNLVKLLPKLDPAKPLMYAQVCAEQAGIPFPCGGGGILMSLQTLRRSRRALESCYLPWGGDMGQYDVAVSHCFLSAGVALQARGEFSSHRPSHYTEEFGKGRHMKAQFANPVTFHYVVKCVSIAELGGVHSQRFFFLQRDAGHVPADSRHGAAVASQELYAQRRRNAQIQGGARRMKSFAFSAKKSEKEGAMRRPRSEGDDEDELGAMDDMSDAALRKVLAKDPPTFIVLGLTQSREPEAFVQREPVRDLLNACDDGNNTRLPLWQATMVAPHLVSALLAAGADPWLYDTVGKPLMWCLHYGEFHDFFKNGNVRTRQMFDWRGQGRGQRHETMALIQQAMRWWSPDTHLRFPEEFQRQVFTLLLINRRNPPRVRMPKDVLHIIIRDVAAHAAAWHRDRVVEAEFENHTNWHLICMVHERGLPRMSSRSSRSTVINRLLRYAEEHGID